MNKAIKYACTLYTVVIPEITVLSVQYNSTSSKCTHWILARKGLGLCKGCNSTRK